MISDLLSRLPTLTTPHLRLRRMKRDELALVTAAVESSSGERLVDAPEGTAATVAMMAASVQRQALPAWSVARRSDGTVIAALRFDVWHLAHHRGSLVVARMPSCSDDGLMAEALAAALDFGFTRLDLNRIESRIDSADLVTGAALRRTGMRCEACLRSYVVHNGTALDQDMYAILHAEWLR